MSTPDVEKEACTYATHSGDYCHTHGAYLADEAGHCMSFLHHFSSATRNNGLAGVPCVEHGRDCDGSTNFCEPDLSSTSAVQNGDDHG